MGLVGLPSSLLNCSWGSVHSEFVISTPGSYTQGSEEGPEDPRGTKPWGDSLQVVSRLSRPAGDETVGTTLPRGDVEKSA